MSSEVSIRVEGLSKSFPVYAKSHHRLMQMLSSKTAKHRWYREFHALRNINFEIRRGETVGIIGRNGSGKSTLLQIICGTLAPSAGSVDVNGRIAALLELGAGFNPEFSGRENVFLNGTVLGLSRQEIEAEYDRIVAFADIGDFINEPVKSYSSGMYIRLAFAVAIHVNPDILVVDEALSVGDEAFQRKCFARIEKIRDSGATILFVSHSAGNVVELCNKGIMLDRGQMLAIGSPKSVVSRYQKMLYAPPEIALSFRERLLQEVESSSTRLGMADQDETGESPATEVQSEAGLINDHAESYFDPGLNPKSTVRFEARGVQIEDPHLETLSGRRVNVVKAGAEFLYVYMAHFESTVASVRFGMLIKTVSGVELGGCISSTQMDAIETVDSGSLVRVSFRFRCLLAPGTYFMNAGIRGRIEEEETFLDRILDATLFRVVEDSGRLATGFVDFQVQPYYEVVKDSVDRS